MVNAVPNPTVERSLRDEAAQRRSLPRWAPSAVKSISSPVTNGTRVALGSAAAPSAAAVVVRFLRPGRQAPARASFTRRCLSACGRRKNTLRPVRSGNHSTVRFLANALALARAFVGASLATVVSSSGRGNPRGCRTAVLTPGAVSRRLTFARAQLPVPWQSASPNPAVNRTAGKQGLPVRSALARSAGRLLLRWASECARF